MSSKDSILTLDPIKQQFHATAKPTTGEALGKQLDEGAYTFSMNTPNPNQNPNQAMDGDAGAKPEVAVFFDGACPMCTKEIGYYRSIDTGGRVLWEDVASDNPSCPVGYDKETLLKRFHVKDLTTGQVYDGAAGFAHLWCSLPQPWRWAGKIAKFAPVTWLMEVGYLATLKVRPYIARRFFKHP